MINENFEFAVFMQLPFTAPLTRLLEIQLRNPNLH